MPLDSLQTLLIDCLKDIYNAEGQAVKSLPRLAKAASSPELKAAFQEHLDATHGQVERLDAVFEKLGVARKGKKCVAMEGLVAEAKELIDEGGEPAVLDAALIGAAQKMEHYEIASYGSARTFARLLGHDDAAELLQQTLDEESAADEKLTQLAETVVNIEAEQAGGNGEAEAPPAKKPAARPKKAAAGGKKPAARAKGRG